MRERLYGCGVLMVAAGGVFRGGADVETADISGTVEGSLTVRQNLTVRASARIDRVPSRVLIA